MTMDTFWQDLNYVLRRLRQTPGFTASVIVTFALGVGANTTIFSFLDRVLLRPPNGVVDPGHVYRVYRNEPHSRWAVNGIAASDRFGYPEYAALRNALDGYHLLAITPTTDSTPRL